jgi:hypothetical protein
VAIDHQVGKCRSVALMEEPGGAGEVEQKVDIGHGIRPLAATRPLRLLDRLAGGRA